VYLPSRSALMATPVCGCWIKFLSVPIEIIMYFLPYPLSVLKYNKWFPNDRSTLNFWKKPNLNIVSPFHILLDLIFFKIFFICAHEKD
jgi:hypothetical protein